MFSTSGGGVGGIPVGGGLPGGGGPLGGSSSSKRRRTSSRDEEGGDGEYHGGGGDSSQPTKRKRSVRQLDPIEQCQQLYDIVRNHKKEDGSLLCEPFIRVPKRRQDPQYYEVVVNPMDMIKIQQKIKMDEYEDIEQLSVDFDLMVSNAKAYYKKHTQEHKDACDLWDLYVDNKYKLFPDSEDGEGKGKIILKMGKLARRAAAAEARRTAGGGDDGEASETSSTTTDKDDEKGDVAAVLFNQLEELFTSVMTAKDNDDRPLHTEFQLLPSRKKYPSYYEVIENPIDLKMIATKIQSGEYTNVSEMEKDLLTMCRNACQFNETGSAIYKDAKYLKKIISAKKYEIEYGKPGATQTPGKSERIRNRRMKNAVSQSAITAALQYEDDEEEEEEEEEDEAEDEEEDETVEEEEEDDEEEDGEGNTEDPMWALYEAVSSAKSSVGVQLAEPFRRLPSRRFYPDYYKEIKNPISLSQIKARILRNEYVNLTQVQADVNVMFENAKAYNMPDSPLYKSAVKLQKLVANKVQELLGSEDDESSNDDVIVPPKRMSGSNTPVQAASMSDADMEIEDGDDHTPATKAKRGGGKGKSKDGSGTATPQTGVIATTTPLPKSSPGKQVEQAKDPKLAAYKEQIKKRCWALYNLITGYTEAEGRKPIDPFMEKPSRKVYPDYYQIISVPIDMITIKANIEVDKYGNTEEIMKDFALMFSNCRLYNEEGSAIFEDANKLESLLKDKLRYMGPDPPKPKPKKKKNPQLLLNMRKLLDIVRDHKDKNGRVLSTIFQKLPSKAEYPDYYEVIKNPIDLERIGNKQRNGTYESLEQLCDDLMLMFDNACKFNEPDSIIYKDALTLQRLVLQTKLSLSENEDGIPDVAGAVKEILLSIFTSLYNHQDEEGRCYTDTMAELPEHDEIEGVKVRALSLDLIKSRLDRGYYKRLDTFQRDMFLCFERSRKLSRSDSQVFEDSVELQSFFIKTRDEVCGQGEVLSSPALQYKLSDLEKSVEQIREEKKGQELPQEEDVPATEKKEEEEEEGLIISQGSQSESYNEQTYSIGDFVYVTPTSIDGAEGGASMKPNIANIQKLWTTEDGTKWFEGIWFFRPEQTYHIPTRKFLQKEVFRSEVRTQGKLSEIVGKCWVMSVKGREYFNLYPGGYEDEDVYVCEYRYSSKARAFTKLKSWAFNSDSVKLIPRPKSLEPIRVASVFKERFDQHKDDIKPFEEDSEKATVETFPNIELTTVAGTDGNQFYEQYYLSCGPIRSGDFVYVRVENAKKLVARVDSMWLDATGTMYFHGPWFTSLSEVTPSSVSPGRTFYKQEIFQSSIEDTNPLLSICGKCSVLDVDDYIKMRPTEVMEADVFVCESLYDELRRQIKKFDGLKKYTFQDTRVHQDEIYYFRRPITLSKCDLDGAIIPEMPRLKAANVNINTNPASPMMIGSGIKLDVDSLIEDSLESPPSLGSNSETTGSVVGVPVGPHTPSSGSVKKVNKTGKKLVTGYILYSSEVRRSVTEKNPTCGFGEISRMVGQEWKRLGKADKLKYEERAQKMNEEKEAALAAGIDPATIGPGSQRFKDNVSKQAAADTEFVAAVNALKKDQDWVFECCWEGCEWQFEDALDLIEHCVQEPNGHVPSGFRNAETGNIEGDFQCKWLNCPRIKKGVPPFPSLNRLLKHVREIHILKGNGRIIHPEMRSKLFRASRNSKTRPISTPSGALQSGSGVPMSTVSGGMQQTNIVINAGMPQQSNVLIPSSSPTLGTIVSAAAGSGQVMQPQVIVRAAPPPEPLFVTVPPRPQKLLHSEAYIRYIESLHQEKKADWDKTLKATKESVKTPVDEDKLPSQWLANGPGAHTSITEALWALRDFMMRDTLNLSRTLNPKNY